MVIFFYTTVSENTGKKSHLFNSMMPEPALGVPGRPCCRITSSWLQWGQGSGVVMKLADHAEKEEQGTVRGLRRPQIAPPQDSCCVLSSAESRDPRYSSHNFSEGLALLRRSICFRFVSPT